MESMKSMGYKIYIAYYNNGHEYGNFRFYSMHKANSKANIEDAKRNYRIFHSTSNTKFAKINIIISFT